MNNHGYPKEIEKPDIKIEYREAMSRAWLIPWIIAILGIALLAVLMLTRTARAEEASYYTYQSCVREGTSGVFTASGERFNENDLTAAMWHAAFGTLVRVTNLANGKSVVVRINDRGPARRLVKRGRVIDLSKGAFQRIANLKDGVIKVKLEMVERE